MSFFSAASQLSKAAKTPISCRIAAKLNQLAKEDYIKIFFQEISALVSTDKKQVASPTFYLAQYQEACTLADNLPMAMKTISDDQIQILSDLYAKNADALYTFKSKSEDLIIDSIEKSLRINPQNELAKDIKTTLNYGKIPESMFMKE